MNEPAQTIEIAATAVQARLELALGPASAQKARFSCLNLLHSLQSEDFPLPLQYACGRSGRRHQR